MLTQRQRLIVLEKRRRWLKKIINERPSQYENQRRYLVDEHESLEWALEILWEAVYPDEVERNEVFDEAVEK